jgi:hypothetical protein
MTTAAEASIPSAGERRSASVTPLRPLPHAPDPGEAARAALLRRLAADRLRDLRDDGVTVGYVARMYGVDREAMEEIMAVLGLSTR